MRPDGRVCYSNIILFVTAFLFLSTPDAHPCPRKCFIVRVTCVWNSLFQERSLSPTRLCWPVVACRCCSLSRPSASMLHLDAFRYGRSAPHLKVRTPYVKRVRDTLVEDGNDVVLCNEYSGAWGGRSGVGLATSCTARCTWHYYHFFM